MREPGPWGVSVWVLCKSGIHRSVATAEIVRRYASVPVEVIHLGWRDGGAWSPQASCGGCPDCTRPWSDAECETQLEEAKKCGVELQVV
jgi:hypothetical protein